MIRRRRHPIDLLLARCVETPEGCWIFQGHTNAFGYGRVSVADKTGRRRKTMTHRVTYEYFRADIPDGLPLDHLCRVRACANPWHLEPVSQWENVLRSDIAMKTHCKNGHPYTPENTYWQPTPTRRTHVCRRCRTCATESLRRYRQRNSLTAAQATA